MASRWRPNSDGSAGYWLAQMTRAAALDFAAPKEGKGVRFNAVAPGIIDTPLMAAVAEPVREGMRAAIPLRRFGTTGEVAGAVLFLVSPLASYVNGHVLEVDGGWRG